MNTTEKLAELRKLQAGADAIREDLQLNPPGKVTYMAPLQANPNDQVVVETDGFGGATTSIVEGNYPIDYVTKFERAFPSEKGAEAAAEAISFQGATPTQILGAAV